MTAKGDVDQRLRTMSKFTLSIASDRFGINKQRATQTITAVPIPKRQKIKISQLRQKPRALRSQYRKASDAEKAALGEMRCVVRERRITLRRAGRTKKERASAVPCAVPSSLIHSDSPRSCWERNVTVSSHAPRRTSTPTSKTPRATA